MADKCVLGIDTSNYRTSAAVVRGDEILVDLRRFLKVKEGQRGLRQSEALFQHVQSLPQLLVQVRDSFAGQIGAVAYSTRPRPVSGSYMPCFTAGAGTAVSIASALDVPAVGFSHQEGHIEAALSGCGVRPKSDFLGCHFSGGTCEVLYIRQKEHEPCGDTAFKDINGERSFYEIEIVGGTKDISYGQVLDRAGVLMGLTFPCGQALDERALAADRSSDSLTRIKSEDAFVHLSGFDTQLRNKLSAMMSAGGSTDSLIREAFERISDSIIRMLCQSADKTGINTIIMSGGVSSSRFIRNNMTDELNRRGIDVHFAEAGLSSDNAVGTALLGSRYLWD